MDAPDDIKRRLDDLATCLEEVAARLRGAPQRSAMGVRGMKHGVATELGEYGSAICTVLVDLTDFKEDE